MNWRLYSVILMLQIISAFAMFSYIPLLVPIAEELNLTSKQIGIIASVNSLGGIIFGVFSGWLVDIIRTRYVILIGPGLITLSLYFFSISNNYYMVIFANLLLGIGYTIVLPLTSRLIVYYFSSKKLGMLLSLKQSGSTIGQAMGGFFLPILILTFSWRFSLTVLTVLMLLVVLINFSYFFSKNTNVSDKKVLTTKFVKTKNRKKIKNKIPNGAFFLFLTGFTMLGFQASFSAFLIPFLNDVKDINYALAGALLGITQLLGSISRPLLGWISDALLNGSRKKILLLCGFGNVFSTILLVLFPGIVMTIVVLIILGLTCYGWAGVYFTYIVELFGKEKSGIGTGYGLMANCLGGAISPLIFGILLDSTSYTFSFLINGLFVLLITILIFLKLTDTSQVKNRASEYSFKEWKAGVDDGKRN